MLLQLQENGRRGSGVGGWLHGVPAPDNNTRLFAAWTVG
jgi:hypothetical protein